MRDAGSRLQVAFGDRSDSVQFERSACELLTTGAGLL
jgi:hypothetical protein